MSNIPKGEIRYMLIYPLLIMLGFFVSDKLFFGGNELTAIAGVLAGFSAGLGYSL